MVRLIDAVTKAIELIGPIDDWSYVTRLVCEAQRAGDVTEETVENVLCNAVCDADPKGRDSTVDRVAAVASYCVRHPLALEQMDRESFLYAAIDDYYGGVEEAPGETVEWLESLGFEIIEPNS